MHELDLCDAIRARLESALSEFRLPTDKNGFDPQAPDIIDGFLPPKRSSNDPDFPFVIVRPSRGSVPEYNENKVTVKLIIGCYNEEFNGYRDAMSVMIRIRNSFMSEPTLDNKFRLEFPLDYNLYDDQPYPAVMLEMMTEWSIASPQEIPDEGVIGYGPEEV